MPTLRLQTVLDERLKDLGRSGRLKGEESVTTGVVPARDGKGPRYLLQGHGDRRFLRMNSNGYLGLALDAEVKAAEEEAVGRYGTGPGAVRFISGTWEPHVALERRLAAFHDRPAEMLFSSAYATMMGILPPLISDHTAVISDELNHNCIINAIALGRPGEKRIYRHLDMAELEHHLAESSTLPLPRTSF
jgi:glycine C-acetyltransferase